MHVAMLVHTDLAHDARVRKEATSLAAAGHKVVVHVARPVDDASAFRGLPFEVRPPPMPAWARATGVFATLRRSARWYERTAALVDSAFADGPPDALHAHDLDTLAPA